MKIIGLASTRPVHYNFEIMNSRDILVESASDLIITSSDRELVSDSVLCHSSAFEVELAINPLVSAAAPLLTLATQLREQRQPPELIILHSALCHEIKVFENKTRAAGYRSPIILAGRYFLCAFIDEIILNTSWGNNSRWQEQNLLQTFQRESDERFFLILERSCEEAKLHIDLLELGYLCLSFGYEGKYRKKANGQHELNLVLDKIYQLIREERGEFSKQLFISSLHKEPIKKSYKSLPSIGLILSITILALLGIYLPYHIKLNHLITPMETSLQAMVPNDLRLSEPQ